MRVAEYDHVRALALDPVVEALFHSSGLDYVMHQKLFARECDNLDLGIITSCIVRISRYRGNRRNCLELQNKPGQANVARMQNMLYTSKEPRDLRIKIIVSIRDDPDSEHEFLTAMTEMQN